MTGCKECYRRERRAAGLCVTPGCDRVGKRKPKAFAGRYEHCDDHYKPRVRKPKLDKVLVHPGRPSLADRKIDAVNEQIATMAATRDRVNFSEIGRNVGISERSVRRIAKGKRRSTANT